MDTNTAPATRWLSSAEGDNPAGPLFAAGAFAAADIVTSGVVDTALSPCSGSHTIQCC